MDMDDDEVTMNRNHTKLQREVVEDRPKKDVVLRLARDTFPMRREAILAEQSSTASELLKNYQELGKSYIVSTIGAGCSSAPVY